MIVEETTTKLVTLKSLAIQSGLTPSYLSDIQFYFSLLPRLNRGYLCYDETQCLPILKDFNKQRAKGIKAAYIVKNLKEKYNLYTEKEKPQIDR